MDAAGGELLALHLDEAIRAGVYEIALDMGKTEFLSSAGVRVLLAYYQKLKKLGGCLAVAAMSDSARKVMELSGLLDMLEPTAPVAEPSPTHEGASIIKFGSLEIAFNILNTTAAAASCQCFGEPDLAQPGKSAALTELTLMPESCGVGLGAFGENAHAPGIADRVGEWMSICGVSVSLPPDTGVADYMIADKGLEPKAQLLYALCFDANFTHAARFATSDPGGVLIADLLNAACELSKTDLLGIALVGETAGLIGAAMKKSPIAANDGVADYFAHPAVRSRLALTPEPEHAGNTAMVVGIVARGAPAGPESKFLRPADGARNLWAHLHAAVFSFRALPSGNPAPGLLARELVENEKLLAGLHLLNDERPVSGLGQSVFRNGMIWTTPLIPNKKGRA